MRVVLSSLVLLVACAPTIPDGALRCDVDRPFCPPDFECAASGFCFRDGDAAAEDDAASADGGPRDGGTDSRAVDSGGGDAGGGDTGVSDSAPGDAVDVDTMVDSGPMDVGGDTPIIDVGPEECGTMRRCPAGMDCVDGTCEERTTCSRSEECEVAQVCINEECRIDCGASGMDCCDLPAQRLCGARLACDSNDRCASCGATGQLCCGDDLALDVERCPDATTCVMGTCL